MRKLLVASMLLSVLSLSARVAAAEQIDPSLREDLASAIRDKGFICRTCEGGREWSLPNKGKVLQVYCNRNSVVYRVILTPAQKVSCIEPWDEEGRKCK